MSCFNHFTKGHNALCFEIRIEMSEFALKEVVAGYSSEKKPYIENIL